MINFQCLRKSDGRQVLRRSFFFSLGRRSFRCEDVGVLGPPGCFAAIFARQSAQISSRRRDEFLRDRRSLPKPKPTLEERNSESRLANRAAHPAARFFRRGVVCPSRQRLLAPNSCPQPNHRHAPPHHRKSPNPFHRSTRCLVPSPIQRSGLLATRPCLSAPFRDC